MSWPHTHWPRRPERENRGSQGVVLAAGHTRLGFRVPRTAVNGSRVLLGCAPCLRRRPAIHSALAAAGALLVDPTCRARTVRRCWQERRQVCRDVLQMLLLLPAGLNHQMHLPPNPQGYRAQGL